MKKHKYKVLLMSAIICGCLLIPFYIVAIACYGEYMFSILLRAALFVTLALFVLIVYMLRHKSLMIAEFNKTAAERLTYIQRRAIDAPEAFKAAGESVFSPQGERFIDADEYTIPWKYLYRLFVVDSDPWNYTTYAALDIRNGKAYRVIKKTLTQKNVYGAELHTRPIDYDEIRRLAIRGRKATDFTDLSESTWENFIPEDKRYKPEEPEDNRVDITAAGKGSGKGASRFFYEAKAQYRSHNVVYLRDTDKGTALFGAKASDGTIGLKFEFDFTEKMIDDIFNQAYGNKLYARDRLLTDSEIAYVRSLDFDAASEECNNPDDVVCLCETDGEFSDSKTLAKQQIADTLMNLALYGSK